MRNRIQAYFTIKDTEYGCEYDSDHPQAFMAFMASAWGLWQQARELDVLPDDIEPNGAEGLQLLAQMQLVDETELKRLVIEIADFLRWDARTNAELHMRYENILGHYEYSKKPLNIIRKQSDLDFHRKLALVEVVSFLEDTRRFCLDKINDLYPGENYRQRFWTALLDKLISEKR